MKSLVDKLRSEFKISVSEVGDRGHWQIGTLAICYIESSTREDSRIPELIERYIEDKILGKAFLIDVHLDKLTTETE